MSQRTDRHQIIPPDILIGAYATGYFPMADAVTGKIEWYSPDPRAVIELDAFVPTRSLRRTIRKGVFDVRTDTVFEEVIRACGDRDATWISGVIIDSYCELHRLGFAHSVEAWSGGQLAGGLYGVSLGSAFFGESMFHREPYASMVAYAALIDRLKSRGYTLLDTQFVTEHLLRLGAREVPRREYLSCLAAALKKECTFF